MKNKRFRAAAMAGLIIGGLLAVATQARAQSGDFCVHPNLLLADQAGYPTSGVVQADLPAGLYEVDALIYDSYLARGITAIDRTQIEQLSERAAFLGTVSPDLPDFIDPGQLRHRFEYQSPGIDSFEVSLVSDGLSANSLEIPTICFTRVPEPTTTTQAPTTKQPPTTAAPTTQPPTTQEPTTTTVAPPTTQAPTTTQPELDPCDYNEAGCVPEATPAEPVPVERVPYTG